MQVVIIVEVPAIGGGTSDSPAAWLELVAVSLAHTAGMARERTGDLLASQSRLFSLCVGLLSGLPVGHPPTPTRPLLVHSWDRIEQNQARSLSFPCPEYPLSEGVVIASERDLLISCESWDFLTSRN